MKKVFSFILLLLFFIGCSQKGTVIMLQPYTNSGNQSKINKEIFISKINDLRRNKGVIATILDSQGSTKEYVMLQNNLASWIDSSLRSELASRGANISSNGTRVEVDILSLNATLQGYAKDNLKAEAKFEVRIYKDDGTIITKHVSQSQSKFAPIHTGGAFDTFIWELLRDLVTKTANQILVQ
ncbi:YajG family lipoprotein [Campylobacter sputorum]|uniref:YajG family lipoprotein n=1 Tax=Campylobacter sputorum TaxID=206 RepID=UPI00053C0712|nr:YajG family lipoprotein [Campylobacter sputorum]